MARWVVIFGCSYEVSAIVTGRVPTLTQLSARYPALGPVLVVALAIHLYRAPGRVR